MSLSQKHSGKVLVPWFNISEWKHVYNLLYSELSQNWSQALKILQIWKHRTPLLSAGVEGTLIVLEALLVDSSQLSSYELSHIFSTSLVRFLNLCAANSDKQGTFYKTAMKNELPKWLIGIRHDIAHSHKIPSESMLILSLKYCLDWLKGKYWDVQYENMSDFIVEKDDSTVIEDCIYVYHNLDDTKVINEDKELMERISKFVKKNQKQLKKSKIIESVNSAFKEAILINKRESSEKINNLLIEDSLILLTACEISEKDLKKIPAQFLKKWSSLISILHETEILPNFIYKLFNYTLHEKYELKYREVASIWIKTIFESLIDYENNDTEETCLSFTSNNNCLKIKDFAIEILDKLSPFTINFVREVLQYNNAPPQFIEDSVDLVTAFNTHATFSSSGKIFTIEDLNLSIEDDSNNIINTEVQSTPSRSRWTLIEDTSPYINLPLGILPHQARDTNPLLEMS